MADPTNTPTRPASTGGTPAPKIVADYLSSPPPGSWAAFLANQRRFWVHAFSRESLFNFAKTMAWVVPLTILIWVYAEREQRDTDPGVTFPIDVRSSDP